MISRLSSFSGPLSKLFNVIKGFTLNGLILRYELRDKGSYIGTSTVTDLVGNSNASLINGPTFSSNGYLNFDGTNDYLITSTSLNSKLSPPNTSIVISYFIWVYPQDNGVIITEQGSSSLNTSWHTAHIEMVSGKFIFGLWTDPGQISSLTSSVATPLKKWYYVGLTYDGTTMRTYINGQSAGTKLLTRATPAQYGNGLHFGIAATDFTNMGDGSYAKMKFGSFHVYNSALSEQQVISNYTIQKSNYIHTDNLVIYLDANDPESYPGSGTTVYDMINSYNHTATGASFSTLYGVRSFDCTTGNNRVVVNGTGPTLSTTGYTYISWAKLEPGDSSAFRTLIYTNSPKYTPITIPNGTNTLGYWDSAFRSSGYGLTSSVGVWVQYAVVGDDSSQTFYINDSQVGSSISFGAGGTTHWGWGNNDTAGQPWGYVANMMLYSTKLTQAQIKQNYDALKHVYEQNNFTTNNLILYFNPSNLLSYSGSGNTINDISGNSLNGTLSNVTFDKNYFNFNGSNSQVTITDNALLEPGSGNWSIEVWINQSSLVAQSQVILGKFDPGGLTSDISYAIRISNNTSSIRCDFSDGTTGISTLNYSLTLNTWYQIVYVFDNTSNNIITYVNGDSVSTRSNSSVNSILNTTSNLYLGSYNGGEFAQWFNGKIGITRIYNSALSSSEVLKNFNANRQIYGI